MVILLMGSVIFAFITLGLLAAFFITGGKNHTLRKLAGLFGLLAGLLWLIKTFMR
jgi:hypothetical protein